MLNKAPVFVNSFSFGLSIMIVNFLIRSAEPIWKDLNLSLLREMVSTPEFCEGSRKLES